MLFVCKVSGLPFGWKSKILSNKTQTRNTIFWAIPISIAVVYHDGKEATKGHYVTEVHHTGTGSWLRFDDSIVRVVDTAQLFKYSLPRMPYLLLYKKVNM